MKTHYTKNLNQSDAVILRDQLMLHAANLRGMVHTAEGQYVCSPRFSETGDVLENIRILETHCTELESRLHGAAPVFEFVASQTATAARPDGRATSTGSASGVPLGAPSAKKLTATERVLAARGVKSLDELTAKMAGVPHDEKMMSARKLKAVAVIIAFFALAVFNVTAQSTTPFDSAGNHGIRNGGTNFIAAGSSDNFTDYDFPFPCTDYRECSFGISFSTASPFAGGTVTLLVTNGILAADGTLAMDAAPDFRQTIPLTSTNLQSVVIGCTNLVGNRFSFALVNTNDVPLTNENVNILFKLIKRGAVDAAR